MPGDFIADAAVPRCEEAQKTPRMIAGRLGVLLREFASGHVELPSNLH